MNGCQLLSLPCDVFAPLTRLQELLDTAPHPRLSTLERKPLTSLSMRHPEMRSSLHHRDNVAAQKWSLLCSY